MTLWLAKSRFWLPAAVLIVVGLINVYSASMPLALEHYGDPLYFFKKQMLWIALALVLFWFTMQVPLKTWRQLASLGFWCLLLFLLVMKFGGLAVERNGAARWVMIGPLSLQPSEFAKPLLVIYLAKVLSSDLFQREPKPGHFFGVLMVGLALMAIVATQPDFGGAILLGVILGAMLFVAGAPLPMLGALAALGAVVGREMILASPYKRGRLLAFMDPWQDAQAYGFQLIQSYLALGNGGLFGRGVGLGMQKLFYLPEAHTDFIFSVLGEEWGFVGAFAVVLAIFWLLFEIARVAVSVTREAFAQLVVVGILVVLGGAYVLNLAVATGLAPTKGLALPLISYGGSAMLASAFALGLVGRVEREAMV